MVVGIDVTHPSPGSAANALSIAGMVASVDRWLGQWLAVLRIQSKARKEMVYDLTDMFKSRLRLWKDPRHGKHAHLPENILVYRDGVSEGRHRPTKWRRRCSPHPRPRGRRPASYPLSPPPFQGEINKDPLMGRT